MAPYVRNKGRLYLSLVEVKATVNRQQQLFIKNTGPCKHASGSIRSDACPVPVSQGRRLSQEKLPTKAPVSRASSDLHERRNDCCTVSTSDPVKL